MNHRIIRLMRRGAIFSVLAALIGFGITSNLASPPKTVVESPAYTGLAIPVSEPASIVVTSIAVLSLATILRRQKNEGEPGDRHS